MTNVDHGFEHELREATTRLIEDNSGSISPRQVADAVSWARRHVHDSYDRFNMPLPPADEHVVLIAGLAAQHLMQRRAEDEPPPPGGAVDAGDPPLG